MNCYIVFNDKAYGSEEEMMASLYEEFKEQAAPADILSVEKFKDFLVEKKGVSSNIKENTFIVKTLEGESEVDLSKVVSTSYGILNNLDKEGELSFNDVYDKVSTTEDKIPGMAINDTYELVTSVTSSINRMVTRKGVKSMSFNEALDTALKPIRDMHAQAQAQLAEATTRGEKRKAQEVIDDTEDVLNNTDKLGKIVSDRLKTLSTVDVNGMIDVDVLVEDSGPDASANTFGDGSLSATIGSQMSKNMKRFLSGLTNTNESGETEAGFLGLPTAVDVGEVNSALQGLLAGSKPIYENMREILENNKNNYKWMPSLLEQLDKAEDVTKGELASLYAKHKVNTKVGVWGFDEEGNFKYYIVDQNEFAAEKLIMTAMASGIKESNMLRIDGKTGDYVMNGVAKNASISRFNNLKKIVDAEAKALRSNKPEDVSVKRVVDAFQSWASYIGMNLSDEMVNNLVENGITYENEHISFPAMLETSSFFGSINEKISLTRAGEPMSYNGNYLRGSYVNALAKHQAKFMHSYISASHKNNNGDTVTSFANNKYMVNRLRELLSDKELLKELQNNAIFMNRQNKWINSMVAALEEGDQEDAIITGLKEGFGYEDGITKEGDKFKKANPNGMSEREHEVDRVNKLLSGPSSTRSSIYANGRSRMGKAHYLTTSDKKVPYTLNVELIPTGFMFSENKVSDFAIEQIYESLVVPEINRMQSSGTFNIKSYEDGKHFFFQIPSLNFEPDLFVQDGNGEFQLRADALTNDDVKATIKNVIRKHVDTEVSKKLEKWEDMGLDGAEFFSKEYMNKVNGNIEMAAQDYIVNSMIVNGNLSQLFTGDPAVYFKSKKVKGYGGIRAARTKFFNEGDVRAQESIMLAVVDTYNNIGKRLAGDVAPGIELSNTYDPDTGLSKEYLQLFLEDKESMSHSIEYLSKLLDGKEFDAEAYANMSKKEQEKYMEQFPLSSEYTKIEGTDAQEFTTLEEHLEVMVGMNKINQEEANEILKKANNETLTDDDAAIIFQPMKPVYVGNHREYAIDPDAMTGSGKFVDGRVYIKSSSFPLVKQFTKGMEIDKLRQKMEEGVTVNGKKMPFARAAYSTAAKIGNVLSPAKIYQNNNAKGTDYTINVDENFDSENQAVKAKEGGDFKGSVPKYKVMQRENFRIQQEVPFDEDKDKVTDGTQQRKLLFSNILNVEGFKFTPSQAIKAMFMTQEQSAEARTKIERNVDEISEMEAYVNLLQDDKYIQDIQDTLELEAKALELMKDDDPDKANLQEKLAKYQETIEDSKNIDDLKKSIRSKMAANAAYMASIGSTSNSIYNEDGGLKTEFTGAELQEIYNKIYKQIFQNKSAKIKNRVGNYDINGEWNVDEDKMRRMLLEEAISMDYPINDQEIIKNKELPLWFSMSSPKFESLLNSIFDNNVRKNKVKGNSFVLGSEDGFKVSESLEDLDEDIKNDIIYVPGFDPKVGLRAMREEDGVIQPDEVLMPAKIRDQNGDLIDLKGYVDDDGMIDLESLPLEALESFGYRIPTQGLNSMAYMRVVGFLPKQAGDLLIAPKDFTKRMGSDFDVDKLFTSMPHLYIDAFGNVKKVDDAFNDDIKFREEAIYKALGKELSGLSKKELRELSKELYDEYQAYKENNMSEREPLKEKMDEAKSYTDKNKKQRNEFLSKEVAKRMKKNPELFLKALSIEGAESNIKGIQKDIDALTEGKTDYESRPALMKAMGNIMSDNKEFKKIIFEQAKVAKDEFGRPFSEFFKEYRGKMDTLVGAKKAAFEKLSKDQKNINALISLQEDKEAFTDKMLQNQLFDVHMSVLQNTSDAVQNQVHKPIDFGLLKAPDGSGLAQDISEMKMEAGELHFSPLSPSYQTFKYMNGTMGKAGIGVFSLDSNLNVLFQGQNVSVDGGPFLDAVKILGDKPNLNLSDPMDIRGERTKTDIIAAFQSAAVDNENEQILDKLNINNETFDAIRAMTMLGYDERAISLLLNQPIVTEFVAMSINLQDSLNEGSSVGADLQAYDAIRTKYELLAPEGVEFDKMTAGLQEAFAEKDIKTTDKTGKGFIERQLSAVSAFHEFTQLGKDLKRIQDVVKMDSASIGKDLLQTKEKEKAVLNFSKDFPNFVNITNLIGDYTSVRPAYLGKDQYIEGMVKEKIDGKWKNVPVYIIPKTMAGFVAKDALIANNKAWSSFFPYESAAVEEAFKWTIAYSDIQDNRISTLSREKKQVFQQLKRFMNSTLLGTSVAKETNRLMYDTVSIITDPDSNNTTGAQAVVDYQHMSLANIIKTFKDVKLKKYEIIQRMNLDVEQGNRPSTIKYGASISDALSEQQVHESFAQLIVDNRMIGNINGRDYTTRDLADDLVRYAYLEGGVQQATQYIKYMPAQYMTGDLFMARVKDLNDNMENPAYILNNTKSGETVLNPFAVQYFQHTPHKIKYSFNRENFDLQETASGKYVSTPMMGKDVYKGPIFKYNVGKDVFIAVKLRKPLKIKDSVTGKVSEYKYKVVSKLGDKGISEYNRSAINAYDSMSDKNSRAIAPVDALEEKPDKPMDPSLEESTEMGAVVSSYVNPDDSLNNRLNLYLDTVKERMEQGKSITADEFVGGLQAKSHELGTHNRFMVDMIHTALKNSPELSTVSVEYGKLGPNTAGTYREGPDGKRIIINQDLATNENFTTVNFAEAFLHEAVHMVTADAVYKNPEQSAKLEELYDLAEGHMLRYLNDLNLGLNNPLARTMHYIVNDKNHRTKKDRMQEFLAHALTNKPFAKFLSEIKTADVFSEAEAKGVYSRLGDKFGTVGSILDTLLDIVKQVFSDIGLIKNKEEGVLFALSVEALYNVANKTNDYSFTGDARAVDGDVNGFIDQIYKENGLEAEGNRYANGLKILFDITKDSPRKNQIVNFIERTKKCR